MGSDGDPTDLYEYVNKNVDYFYFVQGNHDILPEKLDRIYSLKNKDGSHCFIQNGTIIETPIGLLGGVNGTISLKKNNPHKLPEEKYMEALKRLNGVDVVLTHDTPSFQFDGKDLIGNKNIYNTVVDMKPKVHIYGHCHHDNHRYDKNKITFINADSRLLIYNYQYEADLDEKIDKNKLKYIKPSYIIKYNDPIID
jgi:Icc-related predicted phosphoesterase